MRAHGHTTTWSTHIGRARDTKGWYDHLLEWWTARKALRDEAKLAAIAARWDAKREALTPLHADAAPEMAVAHGSLSARTVVYGFTL
ncbi:MAG TPA: hypothetical protein VNP04_30500 [Alphaproteobacteria bacterium]|nr:hypothetical protein [Alphaproteobacteria bacterium]